MAMKPCKECGNEVSTKAKTCPSCGIKQKQHLSGIQIIGVLFGGFIFLSVLGSLAGGSSSSSASSNSSNTEIVANDKITMEKFNQLQTGMSYEQVVQILGKEGTEMSRSDMAGYTTVMYMWEGSFGANMNAMFQNGEMNSKAQFGLK